MYYIGPLFQDQETRQIHLIHRNKSPPSFKTQMSNGTFWKPSQTSAELDVCVRLRTSDTHCRTRLPRVAGPPGHGPGKTRAPVLRVQLPD